MCSRHKSRVNDNFELNVVFSRPVEYGTLRRGPPRSPKQAEPSMARSDTLAETYF
jgi:hypothetical protein